MSMQAASRQSAADASSGRLLCLDSDASVRSIRLEASSIAKSASSACDGGAARGCCKDDRVTEADIRGHFQKVMRTMRRAAASKHRK